jgi:hypothetical protein
MEPECLANNAVIGVALKNMNKGERPFAMRGGKRRRAARAGALDSAARVMHSKSPSGLARRAGLRLAVLTQELIRV